MSARTHPVQKLAEMVRAGQRADSAVRARGFGQHALDTTTLWRPARWKECATRNADFPAGALVAR